MIQKSDIGIELAECCVIAGFAKSKTEARRMIEQGAIRLEGTQITDPFARVVSDGKQWWGVLHNV